MKTHPFKAGKSFAHHETPPGELLPILATHESGQRKNWSFAFALLSDACKNCFRLPTALNSQHPTSYQPLPDPLPVLPVFSVVGDSRFSSVFVGSNFSRLADHDLMLKLQKHVSQSRETQNRFCYQEDLCQGPKLNLQI